MDEVYKDVNWYNNQIIESNWLGKMIFGSDRAFQTQTIDRFLEEIKKSLYESKIPRSNIPNVIYETIDILGDHTGKTLLKYLKQSFGDRDYDKKELLSFDEMEEKRMEDIFLFVDQCRKVCEKWPSIIDQDDDNDVQEHCNEYPCSSSSSSSADGIRGTRDFIFELLKRNANTEQLTSYKRFVLLIQINCFMRSKGIHLHSKAAEIKHEYILKDAQDIIVFSAPILWPKTIMKWLQSDTSINAPIFPNPMARMAVVSLYRIFSFAFDDLLSLKFVHSNNKYSPESRASLDQVLTTCRNFSINVIFNVHPWVRYM